MRIFKSVEEVRGAVGEKIGPCEPVPITQERIDAFAAATEDRQWIHTDPIKASSGPFGKPIAHGFLTMSLLPYIGSLLFRFELPGARINYGLNKVRFPSPVLVDSSLTGTATIESVLDHPAGTLVVTQYELHSEGQGKPACIAETLVVLTA